MQAMILELVRLAGGTGEGLVRLFEEQILDGADERTLGGTLLEAGTLLHDANRNREALHVVRRAREHFARIDDRTGICCCHVNEGIYLDALRRLDEALESFRRAARVNVELRDESLESKIEVGSGRTCYNLGLFETAIRHFQRARILKQRLGDRPGLGKCKVGLGLAHHGLGAFQEAASLFHELIETARELGDAEGEAVARTNLGNVYVSLAKFDEALAEHRTCLALGTEAGLRGIVASAHLNLGITLGYLGDFSGAIERNRLALELTDDPLERGSALQNIGNGYFNLGQLVEARSFFHQALEVKESLNEPQGVLLCTMNLGNVYGSLGDTGTALRYHRRAVDVARDLGDRYRESLCTSNLGLTLFLSGETHEAFESLETAAEIAREIGAPHLEAQAELGLARVHWEAMDDREAAAERCRKAIELGEGVTRQLVHQDSKIGFFGKMTAPYEYLLSLYLGAGGRAGEAFAVLERMKSRSLVELLKMQRLEPKGPASTELRSLLAQEEALLSVLRELRTRGWRQQGVPPSPVEIRKVEAELDAVYDDVAVHDASYVSLRRAETVSAAQVKRHLGDASRPTVLIEYFVGERGVSAFVLSSKRPGIEVVTAETSADGLRRLARTFRESVADPEGGEAAERTATALAELLLAPVARWIEDGDLIYFVPHDFLHFLPLHALPLNGVPLLRNHPVAYAPSSSVLLALPARPRCPLTSCLAYGTAVSREDESSDQIPAAKMQLLKSLFEGEATAIAAQYGCRARLGAAATKASLRDLPDGTQVLHFSCHGRFDDADPLASGLLLYDGSLTARELFEYRLDTELVVLSACDTAFSKRSAGDELIGLMRGFLYAGTRSVVATLWSVDALSTRALMVRFHGLL